MPRRTRKTRKGGSESGVPLTNQRLREIIQHANRAQGLGEFENVISDISDIRKLDPEIFTGPNGQIINESLDALLEQKDRMPEHEIRSNLGFILVSISEKLAERQGGRRGRKSRRGGSEVQPRRVLPEEGKCYEAKIDAEDENFTYLGMYSADQDRPVGLERQPGGFNWVRGWFTMNGLDERKLYISDTLREVQCRPENQPNQDDGAMQLDGGARRGRKSRRKTLRKRK